MDFNITLFIRSHRSRLSVNLNIPPYDTIVRCNGFAQNGIEKGAGKAAVGELRNGLGEHLIHVPRWGADIVVCHDKLAKPISKKGFGRILKNADLSDGKISADGKTTTIYNGDTFTDSEKAHEAADNFRGKINKFINDNTGRIRLRKTRPVIFRAFQRGGGKIAQNDYDWIASNLHPSEAYKRNLSRSYDESEWARGQFQRPVQEALSKLSKLSPKLGSFIHLDPDNPIVKKLTSIGKMFDRMPMVDKAKEVTDAYKNMSLRF